MAFQKALTVESAVNRIGSEYVECDTLKGENSERTGELYASIADKVESLYKEIPVPVQFQKKDPYDSYEDMAKTVAEEQKLRIYNQHTDHPFFSHMEQLAFRAVHDWFGHLEADVDFSPEGEYRKYVHMRKHFTPDENTVMFAEVVGQTSAATYLPDGFGDDRFEQRAFQAPGEWMAWFNGAVFGE